jgi:hypothetical protein
LTIIDRCDIFRLDENVHSTTFWRELMAGNYSKRTFVTVNGIEYRCYTQNNPPPEIPFLQIQYDERGETLDTAIIEIINAETEKVISLKSPLARKIGAAVSTELSLDADEEPINVCVDCDGTLCENCGEVR